MSGWVDMPGQPRTCAGCGEKVTLKGSVWFDTMRKRTWHLAARA